MPGVGSSMLRNHHGVLAPARQQDGVSGQGDCCELGALGLAPARATTLERESHIVARRSPDPARIEELTFPAASAAPRSVK